jgi:hypothetical protein
MRRQPGDDALFDVLIPSLKIETPGTDNSPSFYGFNFLAIRVGTEALPVRQIVQWSTNNVQSGKLRSGWRNCKTIKPKSASIKQ